MDRLPRRVSRFRSILISDLHLGSIRADVASLSYFLSSNECDTLYLVGDIVDLWSFRRRAAWRQQHLAVVQRIVDLARQGTRVVLVPGNHDQPLLQMSDFRLAGLEVCDETILQTARGERYLVIHGHQADRWLGTSSEAVGGLYAIGEFLAQFLTIERSPAPARVGSFERTLAGQARSRGLSGVICGHSHRAADLRLAGVRYLNCGDWLASRTAVVEDNAGNLRLVRWEVAAAPTFAPAGSIAAAAAPA